MVGGKRLGLVGVLLLVALGAGLRLHGLSGSLPHRPEGDASFVFQSELIREGALHPEEHPQFAKYPLLVPYLVQLLPAPRGNGETQAGGGPEGRAPRTLPEHLRASTDLFLRVRLVVALLSIGMIPATYWLARLFVGRAASLYAAFLSATSLLSLILSQTARPHAAAATLVVMGVLACVVMARRGTVAASIVAGVAVGLAIGTLQSALALLPALAAALVVVVRRAGRRRVWLGLLPLACCALAVVAFYPFFFGESAARKTVGLVAGKPQITQGGHVLALGLMNGKGLPVVLSTLWHYEPVATLVAAATAASLLIVRLRRGRSARPRDRAWSGSDLFVLLAYVGPYTLVISLYARTFGRFALPLFPFVFVLAGAGLARAFAAAGRSRSGTLARGALVFVAVAAPLALAFQYSEVHAAPDTVSEAADWIATHHEPSDGRIAVLAPLDLPLLQDPASVRWNLAQIIGRKWPPLWTPYLGDIPEEAFEGPRWDVRWIPVYNEAERLAVRRDVGAALATMRARLVVLEVFDAERANARVLVRVRAWLARNAKRVARFCPDGAGCPTDTPLTYTEEPYERAPHFAWRILRARRFGPVVEVYRLDP